MKKYTHLFGPVPSRRLGMSLGVDLVPHKTCSLDCVYCECGFTTHLIIERDEFVSTKEVVAELEQFLSNEPTLDYITFSGSGEPTLHSRIGEIIQFVKQHYPQYALALLTNSTLLFDAKLRKELQGLDLIVPSMDAVSDQAFHKINRPHAGLNVERIKQGLIDFRQEFSRQMWLEIFIVPGVNDLEEEITLLAQFVLQLSPNKVQLNWLDRPSPEAWVKAASPESIARFQQLFSQIVPDVSLEIVGKFQRREGLKSYHVDIEQLILNTVSRRPLTAEDIADISGKHLNEVNKYLSELLRKEKIVAMQRDRGVFFTVTAPTE